MGGCSGEEVSRVVSESNVEDRVKWRRKMRIADRITMLDS